MIALRSTAVLTAPAGPAGWGVRRIREALVARQFTVVEIITAHLDRLDEVEPWLNATVTICRDEALATARRLQASLDAGMVPGPLFGVPFTVKDVIATAGVATRCGSGAFADNVPSVDATSVARLREAGAVLIAKTNCPEFAFGVTTANATFGETRSPWGEHSPGGSSGGEAALLAAGASAFGLGTDYGGSLRWPAQCCGVVAMRPRLGAVDGAGQLPEAGGRMDGGHVGGARAEPTTSVQRHFQVVGPLARSVEDLALVLAVLQDAAVERLDDLEPLDSKGLTIGWVVEEDSQPVDASVHAVIAAFADALTTAGLTVVTLPHAFDGLHATFNALRATDAMTDLRAAIGDRWDAVGAGARASVEGAPASAADPAPLWVALETLRAATLEQMAVAPLVMFPVAPAAGCALDGTALVDGTLTAGFALMAQCRAVTALGLAALSIPVGRDANGLPVSVQIVATPGHEASLVRLGRFIDVLTGGAPTPAWRSS